MTRFHVADANGGPALLDTHRPGLAALFPLRMDATHALKRVTDDPDWADAYVWVPQVTS
jgi:hypothetical protein